MSKGRILLAGLVAGIVVFIWMGIAHMATGLGMVGIRELPNEAAVFAALQGAPAGFYYFPGMNLPPNPTADQKAQANKEYGARYAKLPSGILVYTPPTGDTNPMGPRRMGFEFLTELAQAMVVIWLLANTILTARSKIIFATAIGVVAAITTNVSYNIWYNFPSNYTLVQIFTQVVGFFLVGVVGALMLRTKQSA